MEFEPEQYDLEDMVFSQCGRWIGPGQECSSTRRVVIRRRHIGLYCAAPQRHQHIWPFRGLWVKREDFEEDGMFAGWVPDGAFPDRTLVRKKQRPKSWQISAARRAVLQVEISRHDMQCMVCDNTWFRDELDSVAAIRWLKKAELTGLYREVEDAISRMVPKPTREEPTWFSRLPDDLSYEVKRRFQMSRLYPDHPLSIAFLRAAKKRVGNKFTQALKKFGVDALAMPVCEVCNLGRGARLFESSSDLVLRWAKYKFKGQVKRVEEDAEYPLLRYLLHLAYETDIVTEMERLGSQRRLASS